MKTSFVQVRPQKQNIFDNYDLNYSFHFSKLVGAFPYNIAYNSITCNYWSLAVLLANFVHFSIAESLYISLLLGNAKTQTYRIAIHIMELGLTIFTFTGLFVSLLNRRKFKLALTVLNEINSLLQQLNSNELPKKFTYCLARKIAHLFPLSMIIILDCIHHVTMTHVELLLISHHYMQNINIFGFLLVYSIFIAWIERVFECLISVHSKVGGNSVIATRDAEILSRIEDCLHQFSEHINDIFTPALLALMVKSLFAMSNNIFWAVTMKTVKLKVVQFMWVMVFLSHVLVGINSSESCLSKARRWDWIFYRKLKTDRDNCIENPRIFLHFINKKKIRFNVAGFFDMSYSFLGKMIVGTLTFVVLIPQILSPIAKPSESVEFEKNLIV